MNIDLSELRKKTVLLYSVGRAMLSAGAFSACEAAAQLGTYPYMTTCAYWCSGLTLGMREAIKNGMEYIVCCDGDTIFDWRHVAYLYAMAEVNPQFDAIAALQVKRQSDAMLWDIRPPGIPSEEKIELNVTEFMPATLAHFGLTIMRTSSLKEVPQPWFLRLADPLRPGESVDEDVYFWRQWTANGRNIQIATRCPVGHVEEYVSLPGEGFQPVRANWARFNVDRIPPEGARRSSWEMSEAMRKAEVA